MKLFGRKDHKVDWSSYMGNEDLSNKQKLIDYANKKHISAHVDDPHESSSGVYSNFRQVVSEVELQRRIAEHKKFCWTKIGVATTVLAAVAGGVAWLGQKLSLF